MNLAERIIGGLNESATEMTDWKKLKKFAASGDPYLFVSVARLDNPKEWLSKFRAQARQHGLRVKVKGGHVYVMEGENSAGRFDALVLAEDTPLEDQPVELVGDYLERSRAALVAGEAAAGDGEDELEEAKKGSLRQLKHKVWMTTGSDSELAAAFRAKGDAHAWATSKKDSPFVKGGGKFVAEDQDSPPPSGEDGAPDEIAEGKDAAGRKAVNHATQWLGKITGDINRTAKTALNSIYWTQGKAERFRAGMKKAKQGITDAQNAVTQVSVGIIRSSSSSVPAFEDEDTEAALAENTSRFDDLAGLLTEAVTEEAECSCDGDEPDADCPVHGAKGESCGRPHDKPDDDDDEEGDDESEAEQEDGGDDALTEAKGIEVDVPGWGKVGVSGTGKWKQWWHQQDGSAKMAYTKAHGGMAKMFYQMRNSAQAPSSLVSRARKDLAAALKTKTEEQKHKRGALVPPGSKVPTVAVDPDDQEESADAADCIEGWERAVKGEAKADAEAPAESALSEDKDVGNSQRDLLGVIKQLRKVALKATKTLIWASDYGDRYQNHMRDAKRSLQQGVAVLGYLH